MPDEYTLDRETYRSVKKMDREQLQKLLTSIDEHICIGQKGRGIKGCRL